MRGLSAAETRSHASALIAAAGLHLLLLGSAPVGLPTMRVALGRGASAMDFVMVEPIAAADSPVETAHRPPPPPRTRIESQRSQAPVDTPATPSAETAAAPSEPVVGSDVGSGAASATPASTASEGTLGPATSNAGISTAGLGGESSMPSSASGNQGGLAVDLRGLARGYRSAIHQSIGRLPPLRGLRDPIDAYVIVGLRIDSTGRVRSVRIVRPSGHPMVDAHVLEFFRSIDRLPAPPSALRLDERELGYRVDVGDR